MNLILCGMMGSGKTTVGIKLAEILGRDWYDTDSMIVKKHGEISSIFERFGEAHFRGLETATVRELAEKDGLVVSTGGGLVLKEENNELLKKNGEIIFLRATIETLAQRLNADGERPLLHNTAESLYARLSRLIKERTPIYEKTADYIVDVDGKSPETIAQEIIETTSCKN